MIQTVTGTLSKNFHGNVLSHEHIRCVSNDMLKAFGEKWLDDGVFIEHALKILKILKDNYGVRLIVDGTPMDLGRDVRFLRELSLRSGVEIVVSSGLYTYPSMLTLNKSEETMAGWFLEEVERGIENTSVKPGILKCATDNYGITGENERRIGALARVQAQTGLPLYVHCLHQGDTARKAWRILTDRGAEPSKIIMGHIARCQYEYIADFLDEGCYVCIDQCHCFPNDTKRIAQTLVRLQERGYGERVLLSNDCCMYSDFCESGNEWTKITQVKETFGYIFETVREEFYKCGGDEISYQKMVGQNALKILNV